MDKFMIARFCRAFLLGLTGSGVLLGGAINAQAAVSQSPLSLTIGVPPNIIFTLDDSTSMAWAHVPDSPDGGYNTKRYRSAYFNPMYYNPNITYATPKTFSSTGVETQLATTFESAYLDGYNPSNGTINLKSDYKVTRNYNTPGGTHTYASDPIEESISCSVSISKKQTKTCVISGTTYSIYRGDTNSSCSIISPSNTDYSCSLNSGTATLSRKSKPAYYYVYDKSKNNCNQTKTDEDCYKYIEVTSSSGNPDRPNNTEGRDERKNFANWYSFYRTRALATLSAASLAFYELSPAARLTWQSLINCKSLDSNSSGCGNNRISPYTSAHRTNFFQWLQKETKFKTAEGTQLRSAMIRAGEYLKTETPWLKNPHGSGNTAINTYACRPSYHVVMTDGMWNDNSGSENSKLTTPKNHDNQTITLPDSKGKFSNQRPFYDENPIDSKSRYSLADYAMQYWSTDLRETLPNKVPAFIPYQDRDTSKQTWDPRNNPATWQHMVNFMMGLGLTASLSKPDIPWEGSTFSGAGYSALKAGTAVWPRVSGDDESDDNKNNVYDLWHAALNSRGEFFSVDTPDAMVQAFEDILNRIAERKSTAARPAITSGLIESDDDSSTIKSYYYQTSYASDENWSGDLKRRCRGCDPLNPDRLVDDWSAKSQMPSHENRTIKIADSNTSNLSRLQSFTWKSADANTVGTLAYWLSDNPESSGWASDSLGQARLNYLKGDRSKENDGTFRQRSSVLGDLYASSPVTVSGPRYLRTFADRLEGHAASDSNSYTSFANSIEGIATGSTKRTSRVYVGGNDGMLHAFNSETGVEEFAFIPTAIFPKLNKLTGKNYTHEFYVDGSPVVADVYNGTEWRTILVGTLRAGGKALFALDVTTPGQEKLLWEFDASKVSEASAVKPGYSFPRPTIARLHNGKWAVVTGNGYEGDNTSGGKAALYIIDAISGTLTKSLEVTGTTGVANGLSSPTLADYDADGVADYAYAGDLQGNLWRFDLLGANANPERAPSKGSIYGDKNSSTVDFKVAYGGQPMFKATSSKDSARQPITVAPSLIRHPSGSGYLIVFGTGRFFEDGDKDGVKTHAQSVYAIWDRQTRAETTTEYIVSRSQLVQQTITNAVTGSDGTTNTAARIISNTPIVWITKDDQGKELTSKTKYGWYLDLQVKDGALDGEMLVENMATLGQTLFFQTLIPNDDPCADGASNWTYALNPYTGGRTNHHAFEIHYLNGEIKEVVSAIKQDGEGGITIAQRPDRNFELCTGQECVKVYPDPASIGRQTWRKVTEE